MTPKEKAEELYNESYKRWALELSHHKNVLIAKSISIYIVDEILDAIVISYDFDALNEYWEKVKQEIKKL